MPKIVTTAEITTSPLDRLLSVKEVAVITNIKEGTLNRSRLTGANAPPYIKIGSSVRYRSSSLQKWIESQQEHTSTSEVSTDKQQAQ